MLSKYLALPVLACLVLMSSADAQQKRDYTQLDPKPYDAATDYDIDMWYSNWRDGAEHVTYGSLVERDILIHGDDPYKPTVKGGVLQYIKRFTHASLAPGLSTTPTTLKDEQIVFYVDGGEGIVRAGGDEGQLHNGVGVLMPLDLEFTIENTGTDYLTMYVIAEPVPAGFKPNKSMLARDENLRRIPGTKGHWSHISKTLFMPVDGLATMGGMAPVWFDRMTMGQPHSHREELEEIWFALEGDIHILLGKQMRHFPVGSAYKIPPDHLTPHSNINVSDKPVKLFWFIKRNDPEPPHPSYAMLNSRPYDPERDPDIDMYIGSWRESTSFQTHGNLLERDVLRKGHGDPMNPPIKGSVLEYVNRFTHALLFPGTLTLPTTLEGEQEIFYILKGTGTITGGGETYPLHPGVTVLAPEGLEFQIRNTGSEHMEMYLISEPVPEGFKPVDHLVVHDEAETPFHTTTAHWVNKNKYLIEENEGLATIQLLLTVELDPETFAQPHSHGEGVEEVWAAVDGDITFELGEEVRRLPDGTAYMIPPDGSTPHANFNASDKPIKLFYFARFGE